MTTPEPPESRTSPEAGEVMQALIRTTHRLHRQFEAELLAAGNPAFLTGPRLRVLIAVQEAGEIRMSDLADRLGIKARTVTQFVDAMEQENMLVREPDPSDRRATVIRLAERAPPLILKARTDMAQASSKTLAALSDEERTELLRLLGKLGTGGEFCEA